MTTTRMRRRRDRSCPSSGGVCHPCISFFSSSLPTKVEEEKEVEYEEEERKQYMKEIATDEKGEGEDDDDNNNEEGGSPLLVVWQWKPSLQEWKQNQQSNRVDKRMRCR
jgi:hypothetical protein